MILSYHAIIDCLLAPAHCLGLVGRARLFFERVGLAANYLVDIAQGTLDSRLLDVGFDHVQPTKVHEN